MKDKPHTVFLIVGESASGKDTLTAKLKEDGYKVLCSYSTRPRRVDEVDTHIFIKPEEVRQYKDIIAYTKIGDYEYFSTYKQLLESDVYIIDPFGVSCLKQRVGDDIRIVTIYINVPKDIRIERALSIRKDNVDEAYKRFNAEREQFENFKLNAQFDYSISNLDVDKAYKILKNIISVELM